MILGLLVCFYLCLNNIFSAHCIHCRVEQNCFISCISCVSLLCALPSIE